MTNLRRFSRKKSLARVRGDKESIMSSSASASAQPKKSDMAMLFGGILLLVALSGLVLSMRSWNRSFTPAVRFFCLLYGIIALIAALKLFKVF